MTAGLSASKEKWILLSTILASSMAFIDISSLNVALPAIQHSLDIGGAELLWIINAYTLFLSALLLVGGALGDRYGRNRIFGTGIMLFAGASLACGLSRSASFLTIARIFQGIGGALMVPGSLSIITALFPESKRGRTIGTWSMFSALTTVLGPVLGGYWMIGRMGLKEKDRKCHKPILLNNLSSH
jgi:MFS family permease